MRIRPIILAAGHGTRMCSATPKVLHQLLGRPMIQYSVDTTQRVTGAQPVVVVGHEAEMVKKSLEDKAQFVVQEPQLGTGHAVQQAEVVWG